MWCLLLNQNAGMWRGLGYYFVPLRYLCADVWSWAVKQDLTVEVNLQSLYRDLNLSNSNLLSCFMMSHCDCWVYRTRMMLLFELKGIWGHGLSFSPSHWWIIFWDYCSCKQQVKQICIDCLKILKDFKILKVLIMIVLRKQIYFCQCKTTDILSKQTFHLSHLAQQSLNTIGMFIENKVFSNYHQSIALEEF